MRPGEFDSSPHSAPRPACAPPHAGRSRCFAANNYDGAVRNGRLIVPDTDGSNRRTLFDGPAVVIWPRPLGRRAAMSSCSAWADSSSGLRFGRRVMTIGVDGTRLAALTSENENAGMPSWSPDGKQLVYRVVEAVSRRLCYILRKPVGHREVFHFGDFTLNVQERRLRRGADAVRLRQAPPPVLAAKR